MDLWVLDTVGAEVRTVAASGNEGKYETVDVG